MLIRGVPQMQPIGKRLTREQHHVLKQLWRNDGFEEMNTKAFFSLMQLLHPTSPSPPSAYRHFNIESLQCGTANAHA
jgi:hypothetical protein